MELWYILKITDSHTLACSAVEYKWLNVFVEWHVAGKQTGSPGADNQRTVIVPEASPARSHGRCWRWQSGPRAQWQTSAHVKTQLQHTALDVVSASCAAQHHGSTNLYWSPQQQSPLRKLTVLSDLLQNILIHLLSLFGQKKLYLKSTQLLLPHWKNPESMNMHMFYIWEVPYFHLTFVQLCVKSQLASDVHELNSK